MTKYRKSKKADSLWPYSLSSSRIASPAQVLPAPNPNSQAELKQELKQELNEILKEKSEKWGFNFFDGVPIPNSHIIWTPMREAASPQQPMIDLPVARVADSPIRPMIGLSLASRAAFPQQPIMAGSSAIDIYNAPLPLSIDEVGLNTLWDRKREEYNFDFAGGQLEADFEETEEYSSTQSQTPPPSRSQSPTFG